MIVETSSKSLKDDSKLKRYKIQMWIITIFAIIIVGTLVPLIMSVKWDNAGLKIEIVKLESTCKILEKNIDEREIIIEKYKSIENDIVISKYIRKSNYKVFVGMSNILAKAFIETSSRFNFPVGVIVSLAQVESTFKYDAISDKKAIGIMQVEPTTWTETLIDEGIITNKLDLFDPIKNIIAGTYILRHYYDQTDKGNKVEYALTRYLGGTKNGHYAKVMKACGEYYMFINTTKEELDENDTSTND